MPIKWFTGFNGSTLRRTSRPGNLRIDGTFTNWTVLNMASTNNIIGAMWANPGLVNSTLFNIPCIGMCGRKWTPAGSYPSAMAYITPEISTTDNTQGCISINYHDANSSGDFLAGVYLRPWLPLGTSFRWGFRLYRTDQTTGVYPAQFTGFNIQSGLTSETARLSGTVPFQRTEEKYIELEWLADTRTMNIYVDDVLSSTSGPNWMKFEPTDSICVYSEVYNSSTNIQSASVWQFKDMYLQVIESDADLRLGASTKVYPFIPTADDAVQFERPAGYDSNATIAARPLSLDTTSVSSAPNPSTATLTATAVGQQDLYTTDAASVSNKLQSVQAVSVRSQAYNPLAGARAFKPIARLDANTVEAPFNIELPPSTTYRGNIMVMNSDPTGARWTPLSVTNLRIGQKVTS